MESVWLAGATWADTAQRRHRTRKFPGTSTSVYQYCLNVPDARARCSVRGDGFHQHLGHKGRVVAKGPGDWNGVKLGTSGAGERRLAVVPRRTPGQSFAPCAVLRALSALGQTQRSGLATESTIISTLGTLSSTSLTKGGPPALPGRQQWFDNSGRPSGNSEREPPSARTGESQWTSIRV